MKTISSVPGKGTIAAIAAGAMVVASAAPAFAEHRDRDGISAGDVIAGALIIGGIAAVASAASNSNDRYDRDYRYDRAGYGYNQGYGYRNDYAWRGNPRQVVEQCVYAAERNASRYSYGRADVTDVRDIRQTRYGYEVRGRIAVNGNGRDWRRGDDNYGRGWGGDYRGWNDNLRGYDSGTFKCTVERGRIVDIDYSGLRGL
ncbi:MAG: hypothetical protein ACKOW1_01345 [Novosphingobium sp.]|jgi:hypothetical protein